MSISNQIFNFPSNAIPSHSSTKFEEFMHTLQQGIAGGTGLAKEVATALYAIKYLDQKKDCHYNTVNRLVKQFFIQYPKMKYVTPKSAKSGTGKQGSSQQISKSKQIMKNQKKTKILDLKYKLAQNKLVDQVKVNFEEIKKCKEQKTQLSEQVFRYCESQLNDFQKRMQGGINQTAASFGRPNHNEFDSGSAGANNQLSLLEMIETIDTNKNHSQSSDPLGFKGKHLGNRMQVNNYLRGDDVMRQYVNIDMQLLMNVDNQTVKVSFDQNRQLLRGFCLLFKTQNQNLQGQQNASTVSQQQLSKLRSARSPSKQQQASGRTHDPQSYFANFLQSSNLPVPPQNSTPQYSNPKEFTSSFPRAGGNRPVLSPMAPMLSSQGVGYQVEETYCFCQNISYGDMVACDSPSCKYEWFHFPCVGLTKRPEPNFGSYWYCPECLEKVKNQPIIKPQSILKDASPGLKLQLHRSDISKSSQRRPDKVKKQPKK